MYVSLLNTKATIIANASMIQFFIEEVESQGVDFFIVSGFLFWVALMLSALGFMIWLLENRVVRRGQEDEQRRAAGSC